LVLVSNEVDRERGPAALISTHPSIVLTPTSWFLPIGLAPHLGRYAGDRPVTFLVPLFQDLNEERAAEKAAAIRAHRAQFPAHDLIILANTEEQVPLLHAHGAQAFFANHNIFTSEEVFHPLPDVPVEFDAIYNARPHVAKRHELASLIERVVYVGYVSTDQVTSHLRVSEILRRASAHIFANQIVDDLPRPISRAEVNVWLARASVGLCLSAAEGAMFSSIEYLLAGLPIVSTPSTGGRDVFFDPDYCVIADPDPRAIREAVEALRDRNILRSYVRSRTLEKLASHRERFLAFIDDVKARRGSPQGQTTKWAFSGAPFHQWKSVEQHACELLGATAGDAAKGAGIKQSKRNYRKSSRVSTPRRLLSFVGQDDSDILPFFLDHYRGLGIGAFHLILHGTWAKAELTPLLAAADVTIECFNGEPYSALLRIESLEEIARQFEGEWIVVVDADEFLELPYSSLGRTIDALTVLGMNELPAALLQRAAPDGKLHSLAEGAPEAVFTRYDYRLAERMDTELPLWKTKYPLLRVGPAFRLWMGNHHPANGRAAMHLPIRGVLHHFKWRDRLLRSVSRQRGEPGARGNQVEQDAYRRWFEENGRRIPTDGLKVCGRSQLLEGGQLIRPTQSELRLRATLRKARQGRDAALATIPHALPQPHPPSAHLGRDGLRAVPGRIALVTTELLGLRRSGGIGTAMTALADRLASEGHELHVLLCPWHDQKWPRPWADHWEARGCRVHHHPIQKGWTVADASMFVADALGASDWDVIHFPDNVGLGATALLLRSAGLAFQNTQMVVTVHGPTRWHRHGNLVQWTESEALGSELEATSIELADAVVCPSDYISKWCKARYTRPAPPIVVPNSLTGEGRRFGRGPRELRPIRKIVFFGRIEVRKGIDRFIAAINRVIARGVSDFEVVFLGSFVSYFPLSELERRTESWPCQMRILENYTSHDAVDLLRTEDCIAVMPSRLDNSPYCVFECLDNAVPFIATDVGGTAELIHENDRARVLVSGDPEEIAEKLVDALQNGAAPAAMSFDPTLADIDHLALHGNLVDKARASRGQPARRSHSKASVIVYGPKADVAAPPLAEWLGRLGGASVEVMWCIGRGPDTEADWYGNANALNDAARSASHERLFFCHTSALPDPDALTALLTAMDETGADATVCGYRFQSADGISESVAVFAAPAELSTKQNIYGARLSLVRKTTFLEAGGFSDEPSAIGIMEWEFLNRLKAAGRRIIGIPIALATATGAVAPETLTESQAGALTAPWTEAAPLHLQGFMRMALHPDRPARPITHPVSFRGEWTVRDPKPTAVATAAPAAEDWRADAGRITETIGESEIVSAASPLDGIDVADDSLNREGRLRIGSDGRLLDASETYRIQSAADAEACNFLVAENLLDAEQASSLAETFRAVEGQILRANGSALPASSFLWMREISAKRPDAVDPLVALIKNGMARTAEFYGVKPPLFPDLIQLRRLGTGMSALPVRGAAPLHAYSEGAEAPGFTGHLFINDDCEGGALYFTGLDMAVEPKLGRFVAGTSGAYHERAVLRVDSGALLVLSFVMRLRREQISPDLLKIFQRSQTPATAIRA